MLLVLLLFIPFLLASACSLQTDEVSTGEATDETLNLAYAPHDEDIAVANLTAVVMEEATGREVTLTETTPREAVSGVYAGDYDAYQGMWRPAQDDLLNQNEGDIDQLRPWLSGETRASLAAPSYLGITNAAEIEGVGVRRAFVLEPHSFALGGVPQEVFEKHGLQPEYYSDMASLWKEAEPLYRREEPFVVLAYAPNWTNLEYELDYLEGESSMQNFNAPYEISSVARAGLADEAPLALAMIDELRLSVPQLEDLEATIQSAENPRSGAEEWASDNAALMNSWVYTSRQSIS